MGWRKVKWKEKGGWEKKRWMRRGNVGKKKMWIERRNVVGKEKGG